MKIVIFGATGKTGKHVVYQGLEKRFEIKAFVRDPNKLFTGDDWDNGKSVYLENNMWYYSSSAVIGNLHSAVIPESQVNVMGGRYISLDVWYDNEMGYAQRVIDAIARFHERGILFSR